jgi:carbamoyltransferase
LIVPIPLYQYVEATASARAYQTRFGELASLPGVTIHDPLPDFHRCSRSERRGFRFRHDCHLTPSAHQVLARSLAPVIRAMLPVGGSRAA